MSASHLGVQSSVLLDKYVTGAQKFNEQDNKNRKQYNANNSREANNANEYLQIKIEIILTFS